MTETANLFTSANEKKMISLFPSGRFSHCCVNLFGYLTRLLTLKVVGR